MKNQWRLIAGIIVLFIIIVFAVLNVDDVPVNFGFGEVIAPLIIIIFISLLLGSLLTLLVSTVATGHRNKELKTLRGKVNQQEEQSQEAIKRVRTQYEERIQALQESLAAKESEINQLRQTETTVPSYTDTNRRDLYQ
ncbi:lipopolysaccharide assembly protein LapA domain-containing protein [Jeotgalibaca caeni]|uniref:lipopolysaccharide assembly protein LapA domain-containing protein n=1 Tax=Jeotgalibaca caeni TaxID=3028623 RepID=UPI00237E2138|nr:lipopolysaccharide assembly protein LapA domain-containing protein [Jeotgalibaca caeni]MDE1547902.1 lipopolysaccharide assembly protein LapA domain-containing protein [Jeotgalibaca caeni]